MDAEQIIKVIKEFVPLLIGLMFFGLLLAGIKVGWPVVRGVVKELTDKAGPNAMTFGLAIGYGLSACLSALADQAETLGWDVLSALAKVVNPFIVGILAFTAKSELKPLTPPSDPSRSDAGTPSTPPNDPPGTGA